MRSDAIMTPFLHIGLLYTYRTVQIYRIEHKIWRTPLTVLCIRFNTDCLGSPVHFRARQGSCLFTDQAIASLPSKGSLSFDPSGWNFLIPSKIVFGTKFMKREKKLFFHSLVYCHTIISPLSLLLSENYPNCPSREETSGNI